MPSDMTLDWAYAANGYCMFSKAEPWASGPQEREPDPADTTFCPNCDVQIDRDEDGRWALEGRCCHDLVVEASDDTIYCCRQCLVDAMYKRGNDTTKYALRKLYAGMLLIDAAKGEIGKHFGERKLDAAAAAMFEAVKQFNALLQQVAGDMVPWMYDIEDNGLGGAE